MITIKAGCILIKDRKLLVVRVDLESWFILPGGSVEDGEMPINAAIRELEEETTIRVTVYQMELFTVRNNASNSARLHVYLVKNWHGEIKPDNEIGEFKWVTSKNIVELPPGSVVADYVLGRLKTEDVID